MNNHYIQYLKLDEEDSEEGDGEDATVESDTSYEGLTTMINNY